MIVVDDIHKHFGGFHAVDGAKLTIGKGTITGLIGPNGAGKTTILKTIMGLVRAQKGNIRLEGKDLHLLPAYEVPRRGIGYIPHCLLYTSPSPRD